MEFFNNTHDGQNIFFQKSASNNRFINIYPIFHKKIDEKYALASFLAYQNLSYRINNLNT